MYTPCAVSWPVEGERRRERSVRDAAESAAEHDEQRVGRCVSAHVAEAEGHLSGSHHLLQIDELQFLEVDLSPR